MHGMQVFSNDGSLLVSDTLKSLHFAGKAVHYESVFNTTNFPTYGGANDGLDGCITYKMYIDSSEAPLVFIRPGSTAAYYGILRQYNVGNRWYIEVVQRGVVAYTPTLYCFTSLDNIYLQPSSNTVGLQVSDAQGSITFDSNKYPLAIAYSSTVVPPTDPTNSAGLPGVSERYSFRYSTLDHNMASSLRYNSYPNNSGLLDSNIMYSVPCLANSVQRRGINGYKKSCGFLGKPQYMLSYAQWWVLYRNVFRVSSAGIEAGWVSYQAAYQYWEKTTKSGGFLGIGGGSGDSSYIVGNTLPYTPKSINLEPVVLLMADASRYDV